MSATHSPSGSGAGAAAQDSAAHELDHHIKIYVKVFVALLVLTVVTVAVSYLHIPWIGLAVFIGLAIATVKASLVALYFMHLSAERRIIYVMLILMFLCVIGLFVLPIGMQIDPISGSDAAPLTMTAPTGLTSHGHEISGASGEPAKEGH